MRVTRDITKAECPWLDADVAAGTEVEKYRGITYGCISPSGVASLYKRIYAHDIHN